MKHYVVLLDRSHLYPGWEDELPIPSFDHVWVEHPDTLPGECIDHLWRGTLGVTHAAPITAADLEGCPKLSLVVITGPAQVDQAACAARRIETLLLPASNMTPPEHAAALIRLLEKTVAHQ